MPTVIFKIILRNLNMTSRTRKGKPGKSRTMRIPLDAINTLPQPRRTFEEVETLANNIAFNGLMNPLIVALFSVAQCNEHLSVINDVWGTHITVEKLKMWKGKYLVLLGGERRLRACRLLDSEGCDDHRSCGGCYSIHFGNHSVKATVHEGIAPFNAIDLQSSENNYLRPSPHEEAEFYDKYFRALSRANGNNLSLTEFGQRVGRSRDVIRVALRFSRLPQKVREYVESGAMLYSFASELGRLKDFGMPNSEIIEWSTRIVVNSPDKAKFLTQVRRRAMELQGHEQFTLAAMFAGEDEKELKKILRRKSIDRGTVLALYDSFKYFSRVLSLFERGVLGYPDSPFAMLGPFQAWREMLVLLRDKLLPHFERVLEEYPEIANSLKCKIAPTRDGETILSEAELYSEKLEKSIRASVE